MSKLAACIRPCSELSEVDKLVMFDLYRCYYDAVNPDLFAKDLSGKSHVIEMRAGGELRGFSTIALMPFEFLGQPQMAVFSGDTVIHHDYWGEQILVSAFCRFAGQLKAESPARPLFWFLISKGHRTYRYLGLFARAYFPHPVVTTPPEFQERMDFLAQEKFGQTYDQATGLIHFPESRGHLRPPYADIKPALDNHPAVQFFLRKNPEFHHGDELVCLVELAQANLRSFAQQAFTEGLHVCSR